MSYDINHKIIKESLDDDDPRVIRNLLNNSVSEQYIINSIQALTRVFERVNGINSWLFAVSFAVLPCIIAYFIRPVFIKLKPSGPSTFMKSLPLMIVAIGVPALSACLITWFLNKWYKGKDKDLLQIWSKQRKLIMKVPFTENTSIAAGYSFGDSLSYKHLLYGFNYSRNSHIHMGFIQNIYRKLRRLILKFSYEIFTSLSSE